MKEKFKYLDHTADLEFISYGKTLNEVFANSAEAFFTAVLALNSVEIRKSKKIKLSAQDLETLMHDWLNELLFLFEVEFLVFREFKVEIEKLNENYELYAECSGEELDLKRHTIDAEIKAVTYHNLSVEERNGLWEARVLCDV